MKRLVVLVGLALVALGLLGVSSALSLAGDFDPSFGVDGVVAHYPGSSVSGIAVQPDGMIDAVAGGLLARYLPNGSLDPSFGQGGYVETSVSSYLAGPALALQPDGKIVVAGTDGPPGSGSSGFMLARYNPNGSPDTSSEPMGSR